MEIPKEKRPDDEMIWDGTSEELEDFLDKVFKGKQSNSVDIMFTDSEIER